MLKTEFHYNVPAYNTRLNLPDTFIPVIVVKNTEGYHIQFDKVDAWILANIKNWQFLLDDIQILAKEMLNEKAMAKAFGAESLTA